MFEYKSSLFLMDIEDSLEGNICSPPILILEGDKILYIGTMLGEKTKLVSHKEFVKKMEKIWEKANTNREKYRDKMVDQYNKVHKVD
jgi:hypothetical protein